MEADKEESSSKKLMQDNPSATAANLFTDDLILEVLSRLPARSVCRFKCVSVPWRDLIADPVNRKKLPQTLAGFLRVTRDEFGAWSHHFASVPDGAPVDLSLPYLQHNKYKFICLVDSVNGLVLSACFSKETPPVATDEFCYVVCNPATGRWIELPPQPLARANRSYRAARLAFDPAVSSHFRVVEICQNIQSVEGYVTGVDIFSSQTGAWIHGDCGLVEKFRVFDWIRSAFFGGMVHLVGELKTRKESALLVVDMEGKVWKTIRLPGYYSGCGAVESSQGCLYYASTSRVYVNNNMKNAVLTTETKLWCLENYDSKKWVLKHKGSASIDDPLSITPRGCIDYAIHPDCDTVFLVPCAHNMLLAYDMQHQKLVHILNPLKGCYREYLPYVPLFSEVLPVADGQ